MNNFEKQSNVQYVLGFAIYDTKLLLILKARPEFQKGFLNGVGGKIEKDEKPSIAMSREFKEETSIFIPQQQWVSLGELNEPELNGVKVYCFYSVLKKYQYNDLVNNIKSNIVLSKDEPLCFIDIYKDLEDLHLNKKLMYNILDMIISIAKRRYPVMRYLELNHKHVERFK